MNNNIRMKCISKNILTVLLYSCLLVSPKMPAVANTTTRIEKKSTKGEPDNYQYKIKFYRDHPNMYFFQNIICTPSLLIK